MQKNRKIKRNDTVLLPHRPQPMVMDNTPYDAISTTGILSPEECSEIICTYEKKDWLRGEINSTEDDAEGRVFEAHRNSFVQFLDPATDPDALPILDKLLQVVMKGNQHYQYELDYFAGAQIAKYDVGHFYDWHVDMGPSYMGNRKLSLTLQLSSPVEYEGGDLVLHMMDGDKPMPRDQGSVALFPSFIQHKVTPVTSGTRYSLVAWAAGIHRFR